MPVRRLSSAAIILAAGAGLVASIVVAQPARAISVPYKLAPNTWSDRYLNLNSTCYHRVFYGNFGNVAFAELRLYRGNCGNSRISVSARSGSGLASFPNSRTGGGRDSCGSYFWIQAVSPPNYIAVATTVDIGDDTVAASRYTPDGAAGVRHGVRC